MQVHRCNGRIFDRNEDGDLDITDHTQLVAELYHRKQTTYSENKIYPYATLDDLRKDQLVLSAVPHHRTDLILRKVDLDRYDDRDFVSTNLVESYERIMAFVAKHLPDPFYLEGDVRTSIRDAIFREVASNILIHREYMNAFPAKLIIERGQVRTENSNNPHGFGLINPETFSPFPKNPVIARFFREIGRADELGSGVRKLMIYCKTYGGSDPELIEGDIFRIIVKYPDSAIYENDLTVNEQITPTVRAQVEAQVEAQVSRRILSACAKAPLSSAEIAASLGHKQLSGNLRKALPELRKAGFIEYTIPDKPNSRLQKYRLTDSGKHLLKSMQK